MKKRGSSPLVSASSETRRTNPRDERRPPPARSRASARHDGHRGPSVGHHSPHHLAPPRRDHAREHRPRGSRLAALAALFALCVSLPWVLNVTQKLPTPPRRLVLDEVPVRSMAQVRARAGDRDGDGLDDALEDRLLARFSPVALLSPDDPSRPASIEWIRARADLSLGGPTLMGTLVPPRRFDDETRRGSADPGDWTMYGHAYPSRDGGIVLQYWLYFPFNDGPLVFDHESDWEHVSVELDADENPRFFVLARHENNAPGVRVPWDEVPREDGDHPVFVVARGSHAAYLEASEAPFWEHVEDCARGPDGVPLWDTCPMVAWRAGPGRGSPLVNVGERGAPRLDAGEDGFFMRYSGLWGTASIALLGSAAPPGPPFQRGFCVDALEGTCL